MPITTCKFFGQLITASIMWLFALPTAVAELPATRSRPNVILILIDDLNHYGVTAYGANRISDEARNTFANIQFETPNIDRLARNGLRCDNAFAYPLCEATRIALMSGQYNSRNFLRPKAQHASDITFGDTFSKAGYATGIFGKWKQSRGSALTKGSDYIFEFGWDEFCCFDVVGEGQRFINPNLVVNGKIENYQGRTDLDPSTGRRWYGPDICNRKALEFIDRNKDRPFFLYYPMLLVHDEHKPTPDTLPREVFDRCDESKKNDDFKYFPDMLAYMDKLIGKLVAKLDELDLRENTLVVVMGDNGTKEPFTHVFPDGSKYEGNKGATKDNGMHVPLVLSWPGKIPHLNGDFRTYNGLIDVVDIYPTVADAAAVAIPNREHIDGVSFWDQARGNKTVEHRDVIYTWYNANYPITDSTHVVRYAFDKNFKRYAPHSNFPEGRFFDLRTDRFEEVGDKKVKLRWKHYYKEGLDLDALTVEQQVARERLDQVIAEHDFVPVTELKLIETPGSVLVNSVTPLKHQVIPAMATRQNIVWTSSNPEVASINKFGELQARKRGRTTIQIYSWDDASPLATGKSGGFSKTGIQARAEIAVVDN